MHTALILSVFIGTYKMTLGQWYFFSVVLDGQKNQGILQLDYSYGYNNGTADAKVQEQWMHMCTNFIFFSRKETFLSRICGQSYNGSRLVNYDRKLFIRLATELQWSISFITKILLRWLLAMTATFYWSQLIRWRHKHRSNKT